MVFAAAITWPLGERDCPSRPLETCNERATSFGPKGLYRHDPRLLSPPISGPSWRQTHQRQQERADLGSFLKEKHFNPHSNFGPE